MSKLEMFIWCNTVLAIVGTYLNTLQKRIGFLIWMLTNSVFLGYNFYIHAYHQTALFTVYLGLAIFGWISWGKSAKKEEKLEEAKTE